MQQSSGLLLGSGWTEPVYAYVVAEGLRIIVTHGDAVMTDDDGEEVLVAEGDVQSFKTVAAPVAGQCRS